MTAAGLALALALGGTSQDTLIYALALNPVNRSVSVEARLTVGRPGRVVLSAPPQAGPARVQIAGISATDDRGQMLTMRQDANLWSVEATGPALRFRYRLEFLDRIAEGSTGSGFDSLRLYAVTRSLFVAPDPLAFRKTGQPYPVIRVSILPPRGWDVVAGWHQDGGTFAPADGDDLLGSTLAAAPDFRSYSDTAGGSTWQLAIRGRRYFTDSTLVALIGESLRRGARTFGPLALSRVTYTSELGRKGRVSGSLQGTDAIGLVWEPSENLEIARSHDTFHETLHLWFGGVMETERWWTEGVTDYFAARFLGEWHERPEDLAYLMYQSHDNYLGINHRLELTMAEENRRRVGGDNTELLVYRKGMLAGLLLDAAIRRGSRGRRTLDDAARTALTLARSRPSRTVREAELRDAVIRAGGRDAEQAWARVVTGHEDIPRADIARALREVTGRDFPPPAARKRDKTLRVSVRAGSQP